jgi:hypothetical protein
MKFCKFYVKALLLSRVKPVDINNNCFAFGDIVFADNEYAVKFRKCNEAKGI